MMNTSTLASPKTTRDPLASLPQRTTLYDLIAALDAEAGPDADGGVTARVIRALQTYRVSCLGGFEGCQMVLDMPQPSSARLPRHSAWALSE